MLGLQHKTLLNFKGMLRSSTVKIQACNHDSQVELTAMLKLHTPSSPDHREAFYFTFKFKFIFTCNPSLFARTVGSGIVFRCEKYRHTRSPQQLTELSIHRCHGAPLAVFPFLPLARCGEMCSARFRSFHCSLTPGIILRAPISRCIVVQKSASLVHHNHSLAAHSRSTTSRLCWWLNVGVSPLPFPEPSFLCAFFSISASVRSCTGRKKNAHHEAETLNPSCARSVMRRAGRYRANQGHSGARCALQSLFCTRAPGLCAALGTEREDGRGQTIIRLWLAVLDRRTKSIAR